MKKKKNTKTFLLSFPLFTFFSPFNPSCFSFLSPFLFPFKSHKKRKICQIFNSFSSSFLLSFPLFTFFSPFNPSCFSFLSPFLFPFKSHKKRKRCQSLNSFASTSWSSLVVEVTNGFSYHLSFLFFSFLFFFFVGDLLLV